MFLKVCVCSVPSGNHDVNVTSRGHCGGGGGEDCLAPILSLGQQKSIDEALFNDCVCAARYELQDDFGARTGRDLVSLCLPGSLNVPPAVEGGRVQGALDKKAVRRIVHACFLDFGPGRCMRMLSDLQRVLGRWQQSVAFSVGLEVRGGNYYDSSRAARSRISSRSSLCFL